MLSGDKQRMGRSYDFEGAMEEQRMVVTEMESHENPSFIDTIHGSIYLYNDIDTLDIISRFCRSSLLDKVFPYR